jgi:hypothetical protein
LPDLRAEDRAASGITVSDPITDEVRVMAGLFGNKGNIVPTGEPARITVPVELERMPNRKRLIELLDECAVQTGYARDHAARLCRFAADALRAVPEALPREPKLSPKAIAESLTEEERHALLSEAWAEVDEGDGGIKMHRGGLPRRLIELGLCQEWILAATWKSEAEQRAICQLGITRLGLIVAMHLKPETAATPPIEKDKAE